MAINLRIWNPHSERIWWVEQDHFYQILVYDRFEGLHFLCRFWRPTSIFFATFYLLNVSFWMSINLRFWNPHSERIWWVETDHFYQIVVYDRFECLHFLCILWRPTSIFFANFYLLNVSFWMAINLRFWNPHSERIWWDKQVHFYQNVVYGRFEGLHFLCIFGRPSSIFLATFYLIKVSFWMAINLRYLNPHSKRILLVKQDHFYQILVYDRFEGLHFLYRFWRPTRIFFANFYLLNVSFWIAINLRIWNPHSERIWWVEQDHFYQIVVYDRLECLHFLCRFWRPTSIFFANFYLLKVSFWMAIILRFWNPHSERI